MEYYLGVDLGTTFVAAAVSHDNNTEMFALGDRSTVIPAAVFARDDGALVTGDAAARRVVSNPDRVATEIKRRLGDPTPVLLGGSSYAVTDLLGALLQDVLTRVSAERGEPEIVVLTHPANWGPFRRELFEEVPRFAGLSSALTVTEPEAAAAYYAATRQLEEGEVIAVYDLGGGTFDATVLQRVADGIEILGSPDGIERLGGTDFDEAILSFVNHASGGALNELDLGDPKTVVALSRLRQDCVLAKEALSLDTEVTIPVFLPTRHLDVPLTRAEFEDMIRAPVESTIGTLSRALRTAEVPPDRLSAVLLVGGSSRIPLIARMIADEIGRPTVVDTHPKHAVALGAATLAQAHSRIGRAHGAGTSRADRRTAAGGAAAAAAAAATVAQPAARTGTSLAEPRADGAVATAPERPAGAGGMGIPVQPGDGAGGDRSTGGGGSRRNGADPRRAGPPPGGNGGTRDGWPEDAPGERPMASPPPPPMPKQPNRRRPLLVGAAALLVVALGVWLAIVLLRDDDDPGPGGGGTAASPSASASAAPAPPASAAPRAAVPIPTVGTPIDVGELSGFVAVSPNGQQLYVARRATGFVTVVDTALNAVTANIPIPAGPPQFLVFNRDGTRLYVSVYDDARTIAAVTVIDTSNNKEVTTIPVTTRPYLGAVTLDGSRLFVPNHDSGSISVIDTATNTVVNEVNVPRNPHWIEFTPDGSRAYVANHESNLVTVLDPTTLQVTGEIPVETSPHSVAVHPTRPLVANVNYDSASVTFIDSSTNQVIDRVDVGRNPQDITWSADGRYAYVASVENDTVSVINGETFEETARLPLGDGPTSVAVLPDGSRAYVSLLNQGRLAVLNVGG
ncbi:Hsp70 family protein [Geodermatophilus sp. CPCC 206100]|uniref:Hsp70 family protein n=1 Tax=Geodermatophilus sp. CPCC 206100 TaxID=3020054 RepID=UPI003AFFC1FC